MTKERKVLLFSDRQAVMDAISDLGSLTERLHAGTWIEREAHWQARAGLVALAAKGLLTVVVPA